jgi:hypothetical protein
MPTVPSNIPAAHPGNDYYVFALTHAIRAQSNPLIAAAMLSTGWDGPFTWAGAQAHIKNLSVSQQTLLTPGAPPAVPGTIGGTPVNPLGGINAIGDFFNRLTQANTWVRVGEVLAGVMLVYLGLSATMRGTEAGRAVGKVTGGAKKAAGLAATVAK